MLGTIGRVAVSVLGLVLAGGFVASSAAMNFSFLSHQAVAPWESLVLGALAFGVTGYNAIAPMLIMWAWENGRRFVATAGAAMSVVFVGFSLVCGVGFTSSNRGAATGSQEARTAELASAEQALRRADVDLAAAKRPDRPVPVIQEALNEVRLDRRWTSSKGCSEATVDGSREYCRGYFQLKQELERALAFARLQEERKRHNADVLRLKAAGAAREADPQANLVVRLSRGLIGLVEAQLWLNSWAALVVEMGAALIPVVAVGHWFSGSGRKRKPGSSRWVPPADPAKAGIRQLELGPDGVWRVVE